MSFVGHKYYFSLTNISHNKKDESVEIIINVFVDDIELEMNKKYNLDLQLNSKNQFKKTDSIFEAYFREKLNISIDDVKKDYTYLGIEFEGDLVYTYLEIPNIINPIKFEISNQLLIKEFEDQQNVVKIKIGQKRKSDILDQKNVKTLLNF